MEAGLLAIAGGQPVIITSDKGKDSAENELLGSRPFRAMMEAAAQVKDGKATTDDASHGRSKEQAPTLLAMGANGEVVVTQLTDPTVLADELQKLQADGALALILSGDPNVQGQQLALLQASAGESELPLSIWSLSDADGGALELVNGERLLNIVPVQASGAGINSQREDVLSALRFISNAGNDDFVLLNAAGEDQWQQLQEQWQQWQESLDPEAQALEGVPLIGFTQLNASWHSLVRDTQVGKVQLVDAAGGKAVPVSPALADAIAQDDLASLSDGDLAELDALIEKITQQAMKRDGAAAEDFRALLQDRMHDARAAAQQSSDELAQPSALSASHASNQTRSEDPLSFRVLQAQPALPGDSTATDQVKVTISQAFRTGLDRVVIQLDPADLGRVDVRLDLNSDGRTQIHIQAENRSTLDMLQRDARMLAQALQDAGIDAGTQDMSFNLSQGDSHSDQNGTNDAMVPSIEETVEALREPELTLDPLSGHYTLSIAQGLDIKV